MDGDLYYFVKWKGYPEYVLSDNFLSQRTKIISGPQIHGNPKKIFMRRIKLKISKPNSDSCRRRQRNENESP